MVGEALRVSGGIGRRAWLFLLAWNLACLTCVAQADGGPFFEPAALEAHGFDLRITAAYFDASRDDFRQPIFLIAQPLSSLHARAFVLQADLRLRITPALSVQCILPWMVRQLDAVNDGLLVSRTEALPGRRVSISGVGLGDPTIAAAYRLWQLQPWAAYAELGGRFPFDDSPSSAVLPERVPLGTGQHVIFLGLGDSLREPVRVGLSQRLGFSPGEHATYLIQRVGAQSYTSGALTAHWQLHTQAAAEHTLWGPLSLQLAAAWTARQWPRLVELGGRSTQITRARWGHDLVLELALRFRIAEGHRLELRRLCRPTPGATAADVLRELRVRHLLKARCPRPRSRPETLRASLDQTHPSRTRPRAANARLALRAAAERVSRAPLRGPRWSAVWCSASLHHPARRKAIALRSAD